MSATKNDMGSLHALVAKTLKERIASGDASASDIANAIKFLKDNGIEAAGKANPEIRSLAEQFPSFSDDDDEYASAHVN